MSSGTINRIPDSARRHVSLGHMGDCGQPAIIWRHSHLNHSIAGLLKNSSSLTPPPPISHTFAFG